jgi:hypothetical protein
MIWSIEELKASEIFNDIDIHLAEFLTDKASGNDPVLYLLILLLSNRLAQGDVCLDISAIAGGLLQISLKPENYLLK